MRRWLLILFVLVLPLRGWLGDAMAGQAVPHAAAGVPAHAHAVEPGARAGHGHDCDEHAHAHATGVEAAQPPVQSAGAPVPADCPTCASCQTCSAPALSPAPAAAAAMVFSHPRPQTVHAAFASAEPAHLFKPPRH